MNIKKMVVTGVKALSRRSAIALMLGGSQLGLAQAQYIDFAIGWVDRGPSMMGGVSTFGYAMAQNPAAASSLIDLGRDEGKVFVPVTSVFDELAAGNPMYALEYFLAGGSILRHTAGGGEFFPGIPIVNESAFSFFSMPPKTLNLPGL